MFCKKCGSQLTENQPFCNKCGNRSEVSPQQQPFAQQEQQFSQPVQPVAQQQFPQPQAAQTQQPYGAQPPAYNAPAAPTKESKQNKKIGVIAAAAVVLIGVIIVFVMIFGGGDESKIEKLVEDYCKYGFTEDYNAEKYLDLYHYDTFKAVAYEFLEDYYDVDDDDLKEEFEEMYEDMIDVYEDSMEEDIEYFADELEIKESEISKYMEIDIDDIEIFDEDDDEYEELEDFFDEYDIEISGAALVEFEVTLKSDDGKESDDFYLYLVKIGSSWYLGNGYYKIEYYY